MTIQLKLETTINDSQLRGALWRGTIFGAIGAAIFFVTGVWGSVDFLTKWGWAVVIISLGLIAYGLIPYKRMTRKELIPDILFIDGEDILRYISNGKITYTKEINQIETAEYYEDKSRYGILVRQKDKAEVRFPYFNQRSAAALREYLDNIQTV